MTLREPCAHLARPCADVWVAKLLLVLSFGMVFWGGKFIYLAHFSCAPQGLPCASLLANLPDFLLKPGFLARAEVYLAQACAPTSRTSSSSLVSLRAPRFSLRKLARPPPGLLLEPAFLARLGFDLAHLARSLRGICFDGLFLMDLFL